MLLYFLRTIRYKNIAMIVTTQSLVFFFLFPLDFSQEFFLICSATVFMAAAGYIINDVYDLDVDRVNQGKKNYIEKNRFFFLFSYFSLNLLSLFCALLISGVYTFFILFSIFLLWYYSYQLKKKYLFIDNISIAFLLCFHTILIWSWQANFIDKIIIIYAIITFCLHWIREIIKDIEDLSADKQYHYRTLPILLGIRNTKMICVSIFFISSVIVFLLVQTLTHLFFPFFLILPFLLCIFSMVKLMKAEKKQEYTFLSYLLKLIMLLGLLGLFTL